MIWSQRLYSYQLYIMGYVYFRNVNWVRCMTWSLEGVKLRTNVKMTEKTDNCNTTAPIKENYWESLFIAYTFLALNVYVRVKLDDDRSDVTQQPNLSVLPFWTSFTSPSVKSVPPRTLTPANVLEFTSRRFQRAITRLRVISGYRDTRVVPKYFEPYYRPDRK